MRLANFIGGEFVAPASGAYLDDIEPATGNVIAQIPDKHQHPAMSAGAMGDGMF